MKRLISVLLAVMMIMSFMPAVAMAEETSAFTDVKGTEYYADAAEVLSALEILTGYEDKSFGAEKTITRAEMAAIICRMIEKEADAEKAKGETKFDDVKAEHWASGYINVASNEGIINGYGDGKFCPEEDVLFEEAVKMVVCALGLDKDIKVDSNDWSKAYLDKAKENKIIDNLKGEKGKAINRGDVAVMVKQALSIDLVAPVASVAAGTYSSTRKVTLTATTKDAEIYYTTDGTAPTAKSIKYEKEISISKTTTLKAVTVKRGILLSDVTAVEYVIKASSGGGGGGGGGSSAKYKLSFAEVENGIVSADVAGRYKKNTVISLTATPAEGYLFVMWESNNGGTFADETSEITTFKMPSKNVVITAVFEKIEVDESELLLNPEDEEGEVSRQEWIKQLVDTCGLTMFSTSIVSNFSDVNDDNVYLTAIEIALQNKVIPYDEANPVFYPEKPATTAFAAVTAAKALRFDGENVAEFITIAAECDIFENASINVNITESDATEILARVNEIMDAAKIDEDAEQIVEVGEDTVILTDEAGEYVYTIAEEVSTEPTEAEPEEDVTADETETGVEEDSTNGETETEGDEVVEETIPEYEATILLERNEETEAIVEGQCIILPATEEFPGGLAQKVVGVQIVDNQIVLYTATPTIDEVMGDGKVSIQGIEEIDESRFILNEELKDEVEIVNEDGDGVELLANLEVERDDIKVKVEADAIEVEFQKNVAGSESVSANGSVKVKFPEVKYKVDIDWFLGIPVDVNELYFALENGITATGNIEVEGRKNNILDGVELGRIPVPLGASGFTVDVVLWLGMSAKGKIELAYDLDVTMGVQYINGRLRNISDCDSNLDFKPLECEFEMGPSLSAMLTLYSVFDLADITASAGYGVNGSATIRDLENICIDATGYVYLNFSALKNSIAGELLNTAIQVNVWDKENSAFKQVWHLEGTPDYIGRVPSCTFGEGSIMGIIKDSETLEPIEDFEILCYENDELVDIVFHYQGNGKFTVENVPTGVYKVKIVKDGYRTFEKMISIVANKVEDLGQVLLIDESVEEGYGSGVVTDALTGDCVENALVELYEGTQTDELVSSVYTNSNGKFTFEEIAGNYTIVVSKQGYTQTLQDFVITAAGRENQNVVLIPVGTADNDEGTIQEIGDLRIVLTWGEYPYDLDSHLCGPKRNDSGRFHVYYMDMEYSENGNIHSYLDLDDITSYGPETTTVYDINTSGKYSFYVHDYSNLSSESSTMMSESGACVKVYVKEATGEVTEAGEALYRSKLIGQFYVPVSTVGTVWHVFDYNAATGELTRKNTMYNESDSSNVGGTILMGVNDNADVQEDLAMIFDSSEEK